MPEVQGSDRDDSGAAEPAGAEEEDQDEMDEDEEKEEEEEEEEEKEEDESWGAWSLEDCGPSDPRAECVLWSEEAESAVASALREGASARTRATCSAPMRELRSPSPARRSKQGCSSKSKGGDRSSGKGCGSKGKYWLGGSGCRGCEDKCGKGKGSECKSTSKGGKDKGRGGEGSGGGARGSKRRKV